MNIFKRLEMDAEILFLTNFLKSKGLPMSLIQQIIAAFAALESTGTATIGPVTTSETVSIFGQNITATESVTVTLKKN